MTQFINSFSTCAKGMKLVSFKTSDHTEPISSVTNLAEELIVGK